MRRERIEMVITGPAVSPEVVPVGLLTQVLTRVEKAVVTYARSRCSDQAVEGMSLSLVDVRPGSEGLTFSVPEPLVPAIVGIAEAIESDSLTDLPHAVWDELHQLATTVASQGWGFKIEAHPERGIPEARLDATFRPPPAPVLVQGATTLHGRCLRVGGATQPRAEVRLSTSGRLLNADLTEEVARQLATRLYEEVVLEGQATWDVETWEVESFRVVNVIDYRAGDPMRAFQDLADAAGSRWEGIEARDYVRGLRRE